MRRCVTETSIQNHFEQNRETSSSRTRGKKIRMRSDAGDFWDKGTQYRKLRRITTGASVSVSEVGNRVILRILEFEQRHLVGDMDMLRMSTRQIREEVLQEGKDWKVTLRSKLWWHLSEVQESTGNTKLMLTERMFARQIKTVIYYLKIIK